MHAGLGFAAAALAVPVVARLLPDRAPFTQELSVALAYVSTAALLLTLTIGPLNVLRRRPNPVSLDLRRDTGICAAVCGIGHVFFSLQHHFDGAVGRYFFDAGRASLRGVRLDRFGVATWLGVGATIILIILLSTSSDAAIRRLGRGRWKNVQRSNYLLAVLTLLHAAVFWSLVDRRSLIWLPVVGATVLVLVLQVGGAGRRRGRW